MSRQVTQQQTAQAATYVTSDKGVSFSKGNMLVDGTPQIPDKIERWESSNGLTQYATVAWKDPHTGELRASCNCPAWTMKKRGAEGRECKHTRALCGTGTCDARRVSSNELSTPAQVQAVSAALAKPSTIRDLDID